MLCPICKSEKIFDRKKEVRGCDKAKVYSCLDCNHSFLVNCSIGKEYYKEEYDTFLAERSKDDFWTKPEEHALMRIHEANDRIRWVSEYIEISSAESILELGCSSGSFLIALKKLYPEKKLWGVEPSNRHREFAISNSLNVKASNEELLGNKFDIVIAFFVLEHIHEPKKWLRQICSFAKKGSKIVMVVPNGLEALNSTYPKSNYDKFIWQAPHLSYFSDISLEKLLNESINNNSNVIHYQRYSLNNHLNWISGLKPKKEKEYKHITPDVDEAYKSSLIKNRISDTLLGIVTV